MTLPLTASTRLAKSAMMPMTTSISSSVKPRARVVVRMVACIVACMVECVAWVCVGMSCSQPIGRRSAAGFDDVVLVEFLRVAACVPIEESIGTA